MFNKFDNTGRTPRQQQIDTFKFLEQNWNTTDVFGLALPCGAGKLGIGRAIQLEHGAHYIISENSLIQEALKTYPKVNHLIGRAHYNCGNHPGLSCEDMALMGRACDSCDYLKARRRALNGEPTVFNPISYFYLTKHPDWKRPDVLVHDECHKLLNTLMLLSGERFGKIYKPPLRMDMVTVVAWMGQKIELLRTLIDKAPIEKAAYYFGLVSRITRVREGIIAEAEKYTHFYDGTDLVIMPIRPPDIIRDRLLDCRKLVLMSASLYKGDIQLLTDKPYKYLELDSPIPEERRRIYIDPAPERIGFNTSPEVVVAWIKRILAKYPHRNTIVHLSYSWSAKLKPFFPGCLTNTPDSKNRVLSKFKKNGRLWLASGVAEGVDLIDDVCGLNLIPILPRANITDAIVRRRLSLPGGSREYDVDIIRTVQQQAGRASRHAEDFSTTVIADPTFWGLVQQYKDELPKSFVNQIRRV